MAVSETEVSNGRRDAILKLLEEAEASGIISPYALLGITFKAPNHLGKITDHVMYSTPDNDGEDFEDPDDGF